MIVQPKAAFDLFESIGLAAALTDCAQLLLREVYIFEVLQMSENRLASVPGFGSPAALREPVESLFDIGRQSNRQHKHPPLYKYSTRAN